MFNSCKIGCRLLPQGGGSPSRTYVMHCDVSKHVTDVHWNHSISSAAQMCIKPTHAHMSACEHFGS